MTDKSDHLCEAAKHAVHQRDFTKTTDGPYKEPSFEEWQEQQVQLPDDAWPTRRPIDTQKKED